MDDKYPLYPITSKAKANAGGLSHMAVGGSQEFPLRVPADNDEMVPRPRYPWLDKASQGVQAAHDFISAPFGYGNPAGEMVSSLLGVPAVAKTMENMAYGTPLTSGSGMTSNLRPETAEAALGVAPLVGPAVKTAKTVGKAVAPTVAEMATELASKYGVDPRMNIIKPKGGNFLAGTPENTTNRLKTKYGASKFAQATLDEMNEVYNPEALALMSEETREGVTRHFPALQREASIEKWIDKKLNPYIKNEMGTEVDPIRLGIERRVAEAEKLKEANQARLAKMEADIARAKAAGKNTTLSENDLERAREKFADEEYIATEGLFHGTAPAEGWANYTEGSKGFEEGLRGKRKIAGVETEPLGTHPASKKWERSVDAEMRVANAKHELRQPDSLENNPWLAKVDPESKVYALDPYAEVSFEFRHMIDELKEAMDPASVLPKHLKIAPKDLDKMTVDDVSALSGKISAWRNRQKTKTDLQVANNPATHTFKEYPLDESNPKGVSWRQIKLPEGLPKDEAEKAVRAATKYEGDIMRHCVGGAGHCEPLLNGKVELYTLRDAKGEPHVTIEVQPGRWDWESIKNSGDNPLQIVEEAKRRLGITPANEGQIMRDLDAHGRFKKQQEVSDLVNEIYQEKVGLQAPSKILEIKGKNNRKPNPEYIPFVKDFVKSGNFSSVGDIHHTDLRTSKDVLGAGVLAELQRRGEKVPPFLDFEDAAHFQELFKPGSLDMLGGKEGYRKQWQAGIQNHAKGGIVRKAIGGITQGTNMQAPTLAQMRMQLNQRKNPDYIDTIGIDQAVDMDPKRYISPTPTQNNFMPVGGVSDSNGLPVGGIDQDNMQQGQQMMPQQQQQDQDQQPNPSPQGTPPSEQEGTPQQKMGNMLSLTPQGQAMQAMGPAQPPRMAAGGSTKGYVKHEPLKPHPEVGTRFSATPQGNLAQRKKFDIFAHEGKGAILPIPYDATTRDNLVTNVSGHNLTEPLLTEAGFDYSLDKKNLKNKIGGASNLGIAARVQDRIDQTRKEHGVDSDIFMLPNTMADDAENFSHHPSHIVLDLLKQRQLNKQTIKQLNDDLRGQPEIIKDKSGKMVKIFPYKGFLGYDHPALGEQVSKGGHGLETTSGNLRKKMMERLSLVNIQKLLDYNLGDLKASILDPDIASDPKAYMGHTVVKGASGAALKPSKHKSYDTDYRGENVGGLGGNRPLEILMPDRYEEIHKELSARPSKKEKTPLQMRNQVIGALEKRAKNFAQPINARVINNAGLYEQGLKNGDFDPKNLDSVLAYYKRNGGYKKGGNVSEKTQKDIMKFNVLSKSKKAK